jgi:uncharacterized protein (TIGR02391 family)
MSARRREPEPVRVKKFSSREEIEAAKGKLQRRLKEVVDLRSSGVDHTDQRVRNVLNNLSKTILDVYGADSHEYRENGAFDFFRNASTVFSSDEDAQEYFETRGTDDGIALIENLIRGLDEDIAHFTGDEGARIRATFDDLSIHPRIAEACRALYQGGHYTDAVLRAALALENYVKDRSGRDDLGGTALMEHVFTQNEPVLSFNALVDQSDKDEQRGFMHMFQGAVLAFRNPRAHKLIQDLPGAALEAIVFISLLARKVEGASTVKKG